jgi:hypothetical protein
MALIVDGLSSFDVYTKFPLGQVLETENLADVCSGMNPCYYIKERGKLKVSSSVMSLILDSGTFDSNPNFRPPKFSLHPLPRNTAIFLRKLVNSVERQFRNTSMRKNPAIQKIKSLTPASIKASLWDPHHSRYDSWETIDKRVSKLSPFESIGSVQKTTAIEPDFSINNLDEYLDKSAHFLRKSIHDIEKAYPHKKQIILMGGKDSQLISLVPKLNESNWYIFSAEPNHTLIQDWVSSNKIHATKIFAHDGRNEETMDDFKKKLICGDLYTNPIHIRYAPTLKKIAQEFNNECIFWLGSMPRGASLYDGTHHKYDPSKKREQFFNIHLNSFPAWQGNIHQTYSNFTECPFLSPYYLQDMWLEVYAHLDPLIITEGHDWRPRLGEILAGRKISWPTQNPGPIPYSYWYFWFDSYRYYREYINHELKKGPRLSERQQIN